MRKSSGPVGFMRNSFQFFGEDCTLKRNSKNKIMEGIKYFKLIFTMKELTWNENPLGRLGGRKRDTDIHTQRDREK